MTLTLSTARQLHKGQDLFCIDPATFNKEGHPPRVTVTSIQTWSTRPTRPAQIRIGIKHGLKGYMQLNEYNLSYWTTDADEAYPHSPVYKEIDDALTAAQHNRAAAGKPALTAAEIEAARDHGRAAFRLHQSWKVAYARSINAALAARGLAPTPGHATRQ